ncbi:MAG: FAD-dependent monooxygenase [SAR86 cluster bacterium]|uniref:FAD-dependent monooxygenase n=1 Tax=SAR86 cluster bacterium TaxID=2030880 RepID=A0A937SAW8_9GAMM|nr:FAD-dependent monooxygenase [SAR86 cluster bacterium]
MEHPVIISGGGIIGCYVHLRLIQAGILSQVIEKGSPLKVSSQNIRTISLNPSTYKLLLEIGIELESASVKTIKVSDGDSSGRIQFTADEVNEEALSHVAMFDELLEKIQDKALNAIKYESEITSISKLDTLTKITLNNNSELKTSLLIGSDGRNSPVAKLSNFVSKTNDYKQTAFTFLAKEKSDHNNSTASQIFSNKGIFALMPIKHLNENMFSVVWSVPNELLKDTNKDNFIAENIDAMTSKINSKITLESNIISFPLSNHHLDSYMKEGVVVVGDAAHSIHPLAGQGINLGFADADILCEEIIEAFKKGYSIGSYRVLKKYEIRRKSINEIMLKAMDGFIGLFGSNNIYIKVLRGLGLKFFNKISFMKVFFINHASGSHKL